MTVWLVDIIDDDVSQNHCVSITALQPKLSDVAICLNILNMFVFVDSLVSILFLSLSCLES